MKTIKVQMKDIVKHIGWSIDGREPVNHSPAFDYCRKLLKKGYPDDTRLEVYREDVLCLICPSIKEGAKWKILENKDHGPKIKRYQPFVSFKEANAAVA